MEELRNRGRKREGRHRDTWDPFQLNPVGAEKEKKQTCLIIMQQLMAVVVGIMVLTSAVISKGSLLTLVTLSSPKSVMYKDSPGSSQFYTLLLMCTLVTPNLLVFLKCLWKSAFKTFVAPTKKTFCIIAMIEILVALGTAILVLVAMPQFDVLTNLFISGGVCIGTAAFHVFLRLQHQRWKIVFPVCSIILVSIGYSLMASDYYVRLSSFVPGQDKDCYYFVAIAIFASLLISLNWWENSLQASNRIQDMLSDLENFRDSVLMITSLLRIAVTVGVYFAYYCLLAPNRIDWKAFRNVTDETLQTAIGLFFLQAFCSAACHWFGVVACKIHAVRMSFAIPVSLTGPITLIVGMILFITQASNLMEEPKKSHLSTTDIIDPTFLGFCEGLPSLKIINNTKRFILLELSNSICKTTLNSKYTSWPFSMLALEGVCMWLGLITCTYYVWGMKVPRIERTSQLFVRRLYESAFIDQSLLLNIKMKVKNIERFENTENCVIYLCATMWHETYDEMLKILTSMFRLDRYRGDPKQDHKDFFDFECHIYVDDAFMKDKETEKPLVNEYVDDLINVVMEVYRVFTNKEPDEVTITDTPYGGRIAFMLPEGNVLFIHLKDKQLIRNKKRWSQIMYMYYLLGWKGYIVKNPPKITNKSNIHRDSIISLDGAAYVLKNFDNDSKRKHVADDNTYILALDGDTDFHPSALILLVDRLRMYANVGAACGRIHPTGMGPMVWYQKFEYAVGHWLQKTAEHVFGCVLCSPGCFSLFRGSAIMDDNVLKRYTTKATRASEYVQYDQGEDRWLCTLLLQQGWRVEYNAASDAYTNSPQEFKEFYNQRRRWGPSTLANTLDLLHSGKETVKRNSSISSLYILYQVFNVASSILGPASVTLMVAGAFQFVFSLEGTLSIIIAVIPPVVYMIICFLTKSNFQITIAAILSIIYAFLMTASFFSIIGDMVKEGTFITPTGLFLVSMAILYTITAILHPQEISMIVYGLMYFVCIPSGYLLLTIYSLVNMHVVSWGTRETNKEKEVKKHVGVLCDRNCKICCWDVNVQVTQESEKLLIHKIQDAVNSNGSSDKPEVEMTTQGAGETLKHPITAKPPTENKTRDMKHKSKEKELDTKSLTSTSDLSIDQKTFTSDDDEEEEIDSTSYSYREDQEMEVVAESVGQKVKTVFLRKLTYANLKRNLQEQIRYTLRNSNEEDLCEELMFMLTDTLGEELRDKVGPEDILTESQLEELQDALTESARRILKTNRMQLGQMTKLETRVKRAIQRTLVAPQVTSLTPDETDFWKKLIERYLKPINDPQAHKEQVERELKSLRNKAVFLYFILNVLWVVATFFLQAIGNDVLSIRIPKWLPNGSLADEPLKVEPLSLMFLLSFAVILLIQFLAMLYHRVYTLIHVLAYNSTEKEYQKKDEEPEDEPISEFDGQSMEDLVVTSNDL